MVRFDSRFLEEIKRRARASDVIGRRVKLKREGREFRGLSPFTNEKTPSFYVNDEKESFFCFSSGKTGDIFNFLMEIDRISFPEAVTRVAADFGVPLPKDEESAEDRARADRFDRLRQALAFAKTWFVERLMRADGTEARAYLTKRGIPAEVWSQFGFGWAPDGWSGLADALSQAGFSAQDGVDSGLLIAPEGGKRPYDRFRGRIMLPIEDTNGRIVSFGGRILQKNEQAKYLNGPETALFHKGRNLYRYAQARKTAAASKANGAIIAEGYLDVVALERAGLPGLAPLGTAISPEQINLLWRIGPEPIFCFDGDRAGRAAAFRAVDRLLPLIGPERSARFAFLPDGMDPDDLLRGQGREAMTTALAASQPLADVLWARECARAPFETPEQLAGLKKRALEAVNLIADADVKRFYVADLLGRVDKLYQERRNSTPRNAPRPRIVRGKSGWRTDPAALNAPPVDDRTSAFARARAAEIPDPIELETLAFALRFPDAAFACIEGLAEAPFQHPQLDAIRHKMLTEMLDGGAAALDLARFGAHFPTNPTDTGANLFATLLAYPVRLSDASATARADGLGRRLEAMRLLEEVVAESQRLKAMIGTDEEDVALAQINQLAKVQRDAERRLRAGIVSATDPVGSGA